MRAAARRKVLQAVAAAGALAALGIGGVAATNAWVARAAAGRTYASVADAPARSVAIVPGARVVDGKPFIHLTARLETALMLYRGDRVKKILVSGRETAAAPEVTAMTTWLREHGVAAQDILADDRGARTRDTMDHAADVFDVRDAVICTQDVNTARSVYLAQAAGIDAVAVGAPSNLGRSGPYMRSEALKTTLSFLESIVHHASETVAAERARRTMLAAR